MATLEKKQLEVAVIELSIRLLGCKWMRYHDLDYESATDDSRRTLTNSKTWLTPPTYVECDLTKAKEIKLRPQGPYVCDKRLDEYHDGKKSILFEPLKYMTHAWLIIDEMRKLGFNYKIQAISGYETGCYFTFRDDRETGERIPVDGQKWHGASQEEPAEAICAAAYDVLLNADKYWPLKHAKNAQRIKPMTTSEHIEAGFQEGWLNGFERCLNAHGKKVGEDPKPKPTERDDDWDRSEAKLFIPK